MSRDREVSREGDTSLTGALRAYHIRARDMYEIIQRTQDIVGLKMSFLFDGKEHHEGYYPLMTNIVPTEHATFV